MFIFPASNVTEKMNMVNPALNSSVPQPLFGLFPCASPSLAYPAAAPPFLAELRVLARIAGVCGQGAIAAR
jgi:hypothetical protein